MSIFDILIAWSVQLVPAATLLAAPEITNRAVLFGVPVPPGFRTAERGRSALRRYRLTVAGTALAGLLGWLAFPTVQFTILSMAATALIGAAAFAAQYRQLRSASIEMPAVRESVLATPEPLPWFAWLGLLPLLFLAGVSLFLLLHWDQIPMRFPVQVDFQGIPQQWAERTIMGVYGGVIAAATYASLMFAFTLASWYGSRQSEVMRKPVMATMLAAEATAAMFFGIPALRFRGGVDISSLWMLLGPVLLILAAVYSIRVVNRPHNLAPLPNECWKAGIWYYNPDDAALFVETRRGAGFSLNLANKWSWVLVAANIAALTSFSLVR
jgi:uncharacterized membrane protein